MIPPPERSGFPLASSGERLGPLGGLAGRAQRALRRRIVPLGEVAAAVPECRRLLEVGCGEGLVLERVLDRAGEIVGVDLDARKLDLARRRLGAASHVRLEEADAFAFLARQPDESFGAVLLVDTLSGFRVPDQDRLLRELLRVLEPGGTLVLKVMDASPRWKAALSRAVSSLVYAVARMSLSADQAFTYRRASELRDVLARNGASPEVAVRHLHAERWHPLPHALLVARRPGSVRGAAASKVRSRE